MADISSYITLSYLVYLGGVAVLLLWSVKQYRAAKRDLSKLEDKQKSKKHEAKT